MYRYTFKTSANKVFKCIADNLEQALDILEVFHPRLATSETITVTRKKRK